jgi:hypothetical protein
MTVISFHYSPSKCAVDTKGMDPPYLQRILEIDCEFSAGTQYEPPLNFLASVMFVILSTLNALLSSVPYQLEIKAFCLGKEARALLRLRRDVGFKV